MSSLGLDSHRIAGSGAGKEAVCDCILFYNNKTYLVEVKAVKGKTFYMGTRTKEQLRAMWEVCKRNNVYPLLAVKFKQRRWNFVEVKQLGPVYFNKEAIVTDSTPNLPIA